MPFKILPETPKPSSLNAESIHRFPAQALKSASTSAVGLPGDILSLPYAGVNKLVSSLGGQNVPYEQSFLGKALPTSETLSKGLERDVPYLKPKNKVEQFIGKDIYIGLGSNTDHSISRRVFGGVLDEGNFQKGGESRQAYDNYEGMITRIEASFSSEQGVPPGILWLASSPTFESSFITERITAAQGQSSTLVVENIPIWVLKKNSGTYTSGKSFEVFVGDGIRDPFIVNDENRQGLSKEHTIIRVPMEHHVIFKKNTAKALRDLAGRRINASSSFFKSKDRLGSIMTLPNLFYTDVLKVNMKTPLDTLMKAISNIEYFKDPMNPFAYRFVHLDIGAKKDRMGIACVHAIYKDSTYYATPDSVNERTQRHFYGEWGIALEAEENQEIPFSLVVSFLIYLKSIGYPIYLVTTDQMEGGRKLRQDLIQAGLNADYLSVDKNRAEYDVTHDLIEEERMNLPIKDDEHGLVFLELSELIDGGATAKSPVINHPKKFKTEYKGSNRGTKDLADGYCGAANSCNNAKHIFNPLIMFKQGKEKKESSKSGNSILDLYNNRRLSEFTNSLTNNDFI